LKNSPVLNFTKIHPVGVKLFHADGQTDRYDKTNSSFSKVCEHAWEGRERTIFV